MEKFGFKHKYTLILLIGALAVYFFMRFFFTLSLPFLLAFLLVWKVYPFLTKLARKIKVKEIWILSTILFLLMFLIFGSLHVPLSRSLENMQFAKQEGSILDSGILNDCMEKYNEIREICCKYVGEDMVIKIQSGAVDTVKTCGSFFIYVVIFFVSLILFCKDFKEIKAKIEEKSNDTIIVKVARGVLSYLKVFLKSQAIIFVVLSILASVTLTILGVPNGWLFGILAGALDAFPFLGTGIVLVPLSIWLFLKGQALQAGFTLALYGICALVRELLEPKLVGEKIGIYPIVMFASVFIGMKIYGALGIIKGPMSVVILYELRKVLVAKSEEV